MQAIKECLQESFDTVTEDMLDKFDNNELDYSEKELCKMFYEDNTLTVLPNYVG